MVPTLGSSSTSPRPASSSASRVLISETLAPESRSATTAIRPTRATDRAGGPRSATAGKQDGPTARECGGAPPPPPGRAAQGTTPPPPAAARRSDEKTPPLGRHQSLQRGGRPQTRAGPAAPARRPQDADSKGKIAS